MSVRPDERSRELASDPIFLAVVGVLFVRVLAAVVFFDPLLFDPFGLAKSAIEHVCTGVLAVLLVWLGLRHGWSIYRWTPIHLAIGLVVLSFTAATVLAYDQQVALFGAWRRYLGLTQILDQAIVYIAAVAVARARVARVAGVLVSLVMSAVVVLYGLLQFAHLDPFRFAESTVRPISTLGNPDILGGFLSIAAVTLAVFAYALWREMPRWLTLALTVTAMGAVGLLMVTAVRNGVLGIGAGLVAAALIGAVHTRPSRTLLRVAGAAIVIVAIALIASPLGGRLSPAFIANDPAVTERGEIWASALREVQARPLLGVGPDNFGAAWFSVRTPRTEQILGPEIVETSTHGWPFYFLTSAGVLGLLSFVAAVVLSLAAALRLGRRGDRIGLVAVPLAAYLAQGLVDVNDVSLDWVPWLTMGLLAGASAAVPVVAKAKRSRRPVRIAIPDAFGWTVTALVIAATLFVQLPRVGASRAELLGQARLNAGAQADAVGPETTAVELDPRRPEYWSSLGTAFAGVNITAALTAYHVAAERAPWDRLHWMNISIAQRAVQNSAGALAAAKRAVAADPSSAEAHRLLASVFLDAGRYEEAAAEGETALRLYPGPQMYEEPILAYIQLKRWDKAIAVAEQAVRATDHPHYYLRLAQALYGAGRAKEAAEKLDVTLQQLPKDAEALDLAAVLGVCTGVSARPDIASPQNVGTKVAFTAVARGCSDPQYKFSVAVPGKGWRMIQDWSASAALAYTSEAVGGPYTFEVDVRSAAKATQEPASAIFGYAFLSDSVCTSVTMTLSPASPQSAGTNISWTATAVGCSRPEFKFSFAPAGESWRVLRDWSAAPTTTFTTPAAGHYQLEVDVRGAASAATPDASATTSYDLK